MDLAQFSQIITDLQSGDNNVRSAAEKLYEPVALGEKISLLFQLYLKDTGAIIQVRTMVLVLLRRLLGSSWEEVKTALGDHFTSFTDQVLKCTAEETEGVLRRHLSDVVAEIARESIDEESGKQNWTAVLKFLEHCIQENNEELKVTAMLLIEAVPNVFGSEQDNFIAGIKQMLESCLHNPSPAVRSAATKAFVSFIATNEEDDKLIKGFSTAIPAIIEICKHVVHTEEDDDGPLQALSDLASATPKILTPHIGPIIEMCALTISDREKDETYRHAAMEVLTALAENSPNTMKKRAAQYIPTILESCLLLMTELDEDVEEWLAVDDVEDGDLDEDTVCVGESSLDRISCSLNGKVILQPFQQIAEKLLTDADWKKRHAALMGLSTIGEGCKRTMEPIIDNVVSIIVPFLEDPHPRVKYAACNALGQMSSDFAPTLQKKSHAKVVGGLLKVLEDSSCPRVCAHAGAALVNFSEDCPQQVITPYLPVLMAKLEYVLDVNFKVLQEKGKKIVLEQIITTIASVADAAKEVFIQFYDRLMPPLKYILQHSDDPRFKLLRGKTIECISLIGLAVGKEKFGADAVEIMNILGSTMSDLATDDPQCSYMISGWTRICKVLGPDFAPFLPIVMEPILRAASYNPEVALVDQDDVDENPDWEYHPVGDNKNFGIRTSGLEEKATACEMIVCYTREMKDAFLPYVDKIAELVIANLKFVFHDGVRCSAAETMPCLLECVKPQGVEAMRRLWAEFFPALVQAANNDDEEDVDVISEALNAIAECITTLEQSGVSGDEIRAIGELLKTQFEGYEERKQAREAEEVEEDEDPEEAKELLDEEMESEAAIMGRLSDVVHAGFSTIGEEFYVIIEPLLERIVKLVDLKRHYTDRQWGICMLDDIFEFAPKRIMGHLQHVVPLVIRSLGDEYPEVRQAAAYGVGIMAMSGGADYAEVVAQALEPLAVMINRADARATEESSAATENAISAVAKILKYAGGKIDATQVIPTFLSWLPTFEDEDESQHIYGYFCDLVEGNHPAVLGPDNSNLPKLLNIVVSAFHQQAFGDSSKDVQVRLVNIIKLMQQSGIFENIVQAAELDEEHRETLQSILTQ